MDVLQYVIWPLQIEQLCLQAPIVIVFLDEKLCCFRKL